MNWSWTSNEQRYDKARWKIEEETRFEFDSLKASFSWFFFLDAGMNAAMPLPDLEEHFSEKRLHTSIYKDEKLFSLLTTPSYNPKNSQSMFRDPIIEYTSNASIDFYSKIVNQQFAGLSIFEFLCSLKLIKMYVSSILILPPDLTCKARLCK